MKEDKIGLIELSPEEERKYDITHNKASFKIGEIKTIPAVVIIAIGFLDIFFGFRVGFRINGFRFSFLVTVIYRILCVLNLIVVFIASTRNTALDILIVNTFWQYFKVSIVFFVFLLASGFGFSLSFPCFFPSLFPFLIFFLFIALVLLVISLFYVVRMYILIIKKIHLYFFATEEDKNKWKEEFIKENIAQPAGENIQQS